MNAVLAPALPGSPPPVLKAAYEALSPARKEAFARHLLGGTSADYLADWTERAGVRVGATSIKAYRRKLREAGVLA